MEAHYSVPTPAHLRDLAIFPTDYCLEIDDQGLPSRISYDLPAMLAPEDQLTVDLQNRSQSAGGFLEFFHETGIGSCSLTRSRLYCVVKYPAIGFDFEEHIRNLEERFPDEDIDAHRHVLQIFERDPEGVIEIWLSEVERARLQL